MKIFKKRKIRKALRELKHLMYNENCLRVSCRDCKHLEWTGGTQWTCERLRLMEILMPEYAEEVMKIDSKAGIRGVVYCYDERFKNEVQ